VSKRLLCLPSICSADKVFLNAPPFSPTLPDIAVQLDLPAVRSNQHAETFAGLLRVEAERTKDGRPGV
jgi:hypothetical protein